MSLRPSHPEALADARADRRTWVFILILTLVSWLVLASSTFDDLTRSGKDPGFEPWVREFASHSASLICFAIIPVMLSRFPVSAQTLVRSLPAHFIASVLFSLVHVSLMVSMRKLTYPILFDCPYEFGLTDPSIWLYEYRKDAYSYLIAATAFSMSRMLEQSLLEAKTAREEARRAGRLTLKSGGRTLMIEADDVIYAQAASNYVEITTPNRVHLARLTLANLEKLLTDAGTSHIRVHRSYIVNRDRIREISPTGDGNVSIRLDTGTEIPGSRSYRERLPA